MRGERTEFQPQIGRVFDLASAGSRNLSASGPNVDYRSIKFGGLGGKVGSL